MGYICADFWTFKKQDLRGFLWFCTVDGISRFDGYGFTNFTIYDGLPDRHVRSTTLGVAKNQNEGETTGQISSCRT
jgi:hypothetical protein